MFNQTSTNQSALALQQQQQLNLRMLTMVNAVKAPRVFDDDRDLVLTRFNVLQACSGVGKGIARVEGFGDPQSVDFTPENPFCKFKVHVCAPLSLPPLLVCAPLLSPSFLPPPPLSSPPLPHSLPLCFIYTIPLPLPPSPFPSLSRLSATIVCPPVAMKMVW